MSNRASINFKVRLRFSVEIFQIFNFFFKLKFLNKLFIFMEKSEKYIKFEKKLTYF